MANPTCDLLLINGVVLTMDPRFTVHRPGPVAVTGDSRAGRGPGLLAYDAAETIDCGGRVIKAAVITDLLALFGTSPDDTISDGYADLAGGV